MIGRGHFDLALILKWAQVNWNGSKPFRIHLHHAAVPAG